MASLDTTTFASALKVLYPNGLEELWYEECPFAAWTNKRTDFEGASKQLNPIISGIRGSNTFATALSAKSTPNLYKFNVTRVKDYVLGSIDNETLMASKSQRGAVAEAVDTQVRAAMYTFGRSVASQIWGNSGGSRGQAGSGVAGLVLTLDNPKDVVHFEVGMELEGSTTDGTSGATLAGSATITAIDRDAGTLTTDANWNAQIVGLAAGNYLFRQGDFGNSAMGVLGWVPSTAPTAGDNHFGVDRSVDPTRLAGIRVSGGGKDMESTIFDAAAQASINAAKVDTLWMNSKRFAELLKSLHSKASYERAAVKTDRATVGFNAVVIPGERGPVKVMADPNCPYAYGLLTRREAWELCSLGGFPHFSKEDGLKFLRESSSDGIEFRLKSYWNMLCKRPVDNVLIAW